MGNTLFHVSHKLHKRNCTHTYELTRIYIRKSTEPKNDVDEKTGKKFGYGQRFLGYAWMCLSCGLLVKSPLMCRGCQSDNIQPGKSDKWGERNSKEYYHCLDCKKVFKIKVKSTVYKLVELT